MERNNEDVMKNGLDRDLNRMRTYEEYKIELSDMISRDRKNSFDKEESDLKSAAEINLDKVLNKYRDVLINNKYVKNAPEPTVYPPIRPFYEKDVRAKIEESPILDIFKKMPKGGNLHIHTMAAVKAENFVNMLIKKFPRNVAVYLNNDDVKKYTLGFFTSKMPSGYARLEEVTKRHPIILGNLIDMLTFSSDRIKEVKYIWDEFNNIFSRVRHIMKVRKVFDEYYLMAFNELYEDNVDYMELRFGPATLVDNNDYLNDAVNEEEDDKYVNFAESDKESILRIRDLYYNFRRIHSDFKLKLIISGSRNTAKSIDSLVLDMQQTRVWMSGIKDEQDGKRYDFIIGYDMVSEEDRGLDTDKIAQAIYEKNITIPFYFHDGESCWANNKNLFSAYLLDTKRVGHGINLFHFPELLELVKKKDIALEICPISNQLLRYTQDLRTHPLGEYLKRGVQCVICSDDPQIFNYSGLSYDFWEVYCSQLIDLKAIKKLIKNSYIYSGMNEEEQKKKFTLWNRKWDAFVGKYGV